MLSIEEVKNFLNIDFEDDVTNKNMELYISVVDQYLKGAIGENYPSEDSRVKQLQLFMIEDLYDRGSYSVKESKSLEKMKHSILMQLQCEELNKNGSI